MFLVCISKEAVLHTKRLCYGHSVDSKNCSVQPCHTYAQRFDAQQSLANPIKVMPNPCQPWPSSVQHLSAVTPQGTRLGSTFLGC